jgi:hypothetical protein
MNQQAYNWCVGILEWQDRHNGHYDCLERARAAVRGANEMVTRLGAMVPLEDERTEVERLRERVAHLEALLGKEGA